MLLLDGISFGRVGYSSNGANSSWEKKLVDQNCIGCCGEVILIAELNTNEDTVEI